MRIRVATYNIEDLRTEELMDPMCRKATACGGRDHPETTTRCVGHQRDSLRSRGSTPLATGANGREQCPAIQREFSCQHRKVKRSIRVLMEAFMAPVNTGIASGLDLDNDGTVQSTPSAAASAGS